MFDPDAYARHTYVTPAPEAGGLAAPQTLNLLDVVPDRWPTERPCTERDYRADTFQQDCSSGPGRSAGTATTRR